MCRKIKIEANKCLAEDKNAALCRDKSKQKFYFISHAYTGTDFIFLGKVFNG